MPDDVTDQLTDRLSGLDPVQRRVVGVLARQHESLLDACHAHRTASGLRHCAHLIG